MISKAIILAAAVVLAAPARAQAPVKVVTTITELAWVANEIGGSNVEVKALLNGTENPHFVDAVPEFIRLVADAQLVCSVGLDLEVGWMPAVLKRSGNAAVQPGGKGFCEAGRAVTVLEKAEGPIDRSMGDVHPSGNPHFWHSPSALAAGAKEVAAALTRVDPARAAVYAKGLEAVTAKLTQISDENKARLAPYAAALGGAPSVIEYHKEFSYFLEHYGLKSFGSVEEKPGVPPSAGRLVEIATAAKAGGVKVALAMHYSPERLLRKFTELSGVPVVVLQGSLMRNEPAKGYADLQREHVEKIIKALEASGARKS